MLFSFSIAPTMTDNSDASMAPIVARAVKVVQDSGLPHETSAMFTTIEGEWDECMEVIKRACAAIAEVSPRVSLVLKADIRAGRSSGEITGKVQRLNEQIARLEEK